ENCGDRIEQRAVSRGARDGDFLQRLAAGSGASNANEQPRSGGCGEAGRVGGVRRDGESGAKLGMFSRDCEIAARIGERRNTFAAVRKTSRNFSYSRICAAGFAVQFEFSWTLE